ncbi:MAG: sigma-70 family RNA polymerase sigma factor [Verrucomicrobia bacterium]|nr:sigma-70 family RNA polymerase sigma factor [Verrucomicrobiota bacterium]
MNDSSAQPGAGPGNFPKTRWSLVLDAQRKDPFALADLCKAYWYPLYCYARRLRQSHEDAEDLTQAFFQQLLENNGLINAEAKSGRLRSFLLRSLENLAIDDWRRKSTQRRGGDQRLVAIDALDAKERYALEPRTALTPALEFDRVWARQLLQQVMNQLEQAYITAGKGALFAELRSRLTSEGDELPYEKVAERLGVSESVARLAAFKLRKRYRELLRLAILETVSSEEEIEEELAHLRSVFGG